MILAIIIVFCGAVLVIVVFRKFKSKYTILYIISYVKKLFFDLFLGSRNKRSGDEDGMSVLFMK